MIKKYIKLQNIYQLKKFLIFTAFLFSPFQIFATFCSLQNGIKITYHNETDTPLLYSVFLYSGVKEYKDEKEPPIAEMIQAKSKKEIKSCTDTDFNLGVSVGSYIIINKKGTSGPDWTNGLDGNFYKYLIGTSYIKNGSGTWSSSIYFPNGQRGAKTTKINDWDKRSECIQLAYAYTGLCYSFKVDNCNGEINKKCDITEDVYINTIGNTSQDRPLGKY